MSAKSAGKGRAPPAPQGGFKGKGSNRGPPPDGWPKVVTQSVATEVPVHQDKSFASEVDGRPLNFFLNRTLVAAAGYIRALGWPADVRNCMWVVEGVLPLNVEDAALEAGLVRKKASIRSCTARDARLQVCVELISGDVLHFEADLDKSVQSLKEDIESLIHVPIGWQVIMLESDHGELVNDSLLFEYVDDDNDILRLKLVTVRLQDAYIAAIWGTGGEHERGLEKLLEHANRGDEAAAIAAGINLVGDDPGRADLALKVLAKTLPLDTAIRVLAKGVEMCWKTSATELIRLQHEEGEHAMAKLREGLSSGDHSLSSAVRFLEAVNRSRRVHTQPRYHTEPRSPSNGSDLMKTVAKHLTPYIESAQRIGLGQHFQATTECVEGFDLNKFYEAQVHAAAAKFDVTPDDIRPRLRVDAVDKHGFGWKSGGLQAKRMVMVSLSEEIFIDRKKSPGIAVPSMAVFDEGVIDERVVPLLCHIADLSGLPSEHTRLAMEAIAAKASKSDTDALTVACWRAGHFDAGVREQALEVLQCVAQASDLEKVCTMIHEWWESDCHAQRILNEVLLSIR